MSLRTNLLYLSMTGVALAITAHIMPDRAGSAEPLTPEKLSDSPAHDDPQSVLSELDAALVRPPIQRAVPDHAEHPSRPAAPVDLVMHEHQDDVLATLGEPDLRLNDDSRWLYGDVVVLFVDGHVAGWIESNRGAAERINAAQALRTRANESEPIRMAGRFVDIKPKTDRRSESGEYRTFSVHDRLHKSRSTSRRTFRQPAFLRAFRYTLQRNDRGQRRSASQRYRTTR